MRGGCGTALSHTHPQTLVFVRMVERIKCSKVWLCLAGVSADSAYCLKCNRSFVCKGRNTSILWKRLVNVHHIQSEFLTAYLVVHPALLQVSYVSHLEHMCTINYITGYFI